MITCGFKSLAQEKVFSYGLESYVLEFGNEKHTNHDPSIQIHGCR